MSRSDRNDDVLIGGEEARTTRSPVLRLFGLLPAAADSTSKGEAEDANADQLRAVARRFDAVDGVVFDMGDVLFDATAWRRKLLQLLRHMGLQTGYRSLFRLWDRDFLDAVHCGRRDYAEAFVAFLREAGLSGGQVDEVVAASNQFKRTLEADVRLFPGVAKTLEHLRTTGLKLAVLTDSESSAALVHERLRGLGIGHFFDVVTSSVELGHTKPHPTGYLATLERLQLAPARTAFVGHDAEELRGARRCGLATIAFNYDRDASADCRIAHFQDLTVLFTGRRDVRTSFRKAA